MTKLISAKCKHHLLTLLNRNTTNTFVFIYFINCLAKEITFLFSYFYFSIFILVEQHSIHWFFFFQKKTNKRNIQCEKWYRTNTHAHTHVTKTHSIKKKKRKWTKPNQSSLQFLILFEISIVKKKTHTWIWKQN